MRADEWIDKFAAEIGARAPDEGTVGELLELAASAAHGSERIAAPIACYLAGVTGAPLEELRSIADRISPEAEQRAMRVAELWRYPVKSMRGERLEGAEVLGDGFAGDRLLRLEDDRGLLTARRKQRLVGVETGLDERGEPLVEGEPWDSDAAAARVREVAGGEARLVRTDGGKRFDAAPVLACTDGALEAHGADRRRFRPNVVVSGVDGFAERDWLGRELRVGAAVLRVVEPCRRCAVTTIDPDTAAVDPEVLRRVNDEFGGIMGMYCAVVKPGTIAVADEVVAGERSA